MKKNYGFDFIRAFVIFFVFIAHIIDKQGDNQLILLTERSISPGMTMSLLGFISGYLLCKKYKNSYDSIFYIKRFSRIYSSLLTCLFVISLIHIPLGYDVINQHSILHYMGLSFFIGLLQVENKSSIGGGLWFVTIINMMYLTLPILTHLYSHKNKKIHFVIIILSCTFLNQIMYSVTSAWNVIISFNIGCYIGVTSSMEKLSCKSIWYYFLLTLILLLISTLATAQIIPYKTKGFLFAIYPLVAAPLFYKFGNQLNGFSQKVVSWFSAISYEVYIIHFYFINKYFAEFFPKITDMFLQIAIAVFIVLPLAYLLSQISALLNRSICNYLIPGGGSG